jgi:hypothetical protein
MLMRDQLFRVSRRIFLAAAGLSFVVSVLLWFLVDHDLGLFVGLWVPSILSLAVLLQLHYAGGRR